MSGSRSTYLGQVNGTRAAMKRMLPRDSGEIVLVGSALAYRGIPLQSAYCGAKHAIQGFIDPSAASFCTTRPNVTITMVQMPGVNTPQFDWIRAKLPGQPRPVGKVYQPEVAAPRHLFRRARHAEGDARRSAHGARRCWGNKVASSMLDEYLAATGFDSQQRPEQVEPDRRDNLFEPVAGDHGAHGSFDSEAVDSSAELWISEHKKQLGLAALGAAAVAGAGFMLSGTAIVRPERRTKPGRGADALLAPASPSLRTGRCSRSRRATLRRRGALGWLLQRAWKPEGERNLRRPRRSARARRSCASASPLDSADRTLSRRSSRIVRCSSGRRWRCWPWRRDVHGRSARTDARKTLPTDRSATVGATGLIGLGFHTYNILKRPGELDALNLFYARSDGRSGGARRSPGL